MLYFDSATHDRVTGTLTVKSVAASGEPWSLVQYRDVPSPLAAELLAAAPHGGEFVRERIAPFYASRHVGAEDWRALVAPDPEWVAAAAAGGAVRTLPV